jgi:hypothetical protein
MEATENEMIEEKDIAMSSTPVDPEASEKVPELEYDQCYSADVFSKVAGTSFRNVDGIYVEQYGGGPQGGLLFSVNGNVYNVNREWCEPFTMKKIVGNPRFVVKSENPDLMRMLKDGEEPIEDEEIEFDCAEWHEVKWAQAKENYEEACLEAEAAEKSEEESEEAAEKSEEESEEEAEKIDGHMSKFLKDINAASQNFLEALKKDNIDASTPESSEPPTPKAVAAISSMYYCFGCGDDGMQIHKFFRHCLNPIWYCEECYAKMPESVKERSHTCGLCTYCNFGVK